MDRPTPLRLGDRADRAPCQPRAQIAGQSLDSQIPVGGILAQRLQNNGIQFAPQFATRVGRYAGGLPRLLLADGLQGRQ